MNSFLFYCFAVCFSVAVLLYLSVGVIVQKYTAKVFSFLMMCKKLRLKEVNSIKIKFTYYLMCCILGMCAFAFGGSADTKKCKYRIIDALIFAFFDFWTVSKPKNSQFLWEE